MSQQPIDMHHPILFEDADFLSQEDISFYNEMVTSFSFPWFLSKTTGIGYDKQLENLEEDSILVHIAYVHGVPNSEHYLDLKKIFDLFCEKNKITYRSILRIRLNLIFSKPSLMGTGAHVDFGFDHKVFLYYFDDSDGDTIFYDEVAEDGQTTPSKNLVESFRSTPKRGKGIVFDGKVFHSPTPPKDTRFRVTLNIDFI